MKVSDKYLQVKSRAFACSFSLLSQMLLAWVLFKHCWRNGPAMEAASTIIQSCYTIDQETPYRNVLASIKFSSTLYANTKLHNPIVESAYSVGSFSDRCTKDDFFLINLHSEALTKSAVEASSTDSGMCSSS